jgi:uncharacterized membrane protein
MRLPYLGNIETRCYLLGQTAAGVYSALGLLCYYTTSFDQFNTLLFWVIVFPLVFMILMQLHSALSDDVLYSIKAMSTKSFSIAKYCSYLEAYRNLI